MRPHLFPAKGQRPTRSHPIVCFQCDAIEAISANKGDLASDFLVKKWQQKGWEINSSGKHFCPSCIAGRLTKSTVPASNVMTVPARSQIAMAKLPEMYLMLGEAYVPATKSYKPAWSDERIAKETGLSVEFVAKRRESDFGPLVVDTTSDELREAKLLQRKAAEAISRITEDLILWTTDFLKISMRIDDLEAKSGQKAAAK